MLNFDSKTLKNAEKTNQHLQQAGSKLIGTLSSTLNLGNNILATCTSTWEALKLGHNNCKDACHAIADNLPIVLTGVCAVSLICPPLAYGLLASIATHPVLYLTCSFAAPPTYHFFKHTDGVKKDTISSAGDVLSNSVEVVKELYHASNSAIDTASSALKSYLFSQGSDHNSEETNDEAVSPTNADQHAITSAGDTFSEVNIAGSFEILSKDEIPMPLFGVPAAA